MKREINPRLNTIMTTIQFLSELPRSIGIAKNLNNMTQEDVLLYLALVCRSLLLRAGNPPYRIYTFIFFLCLSLGTFEKSHKYRLHLGLHGTRIYILK